MMDAGIRSLRLRRGITQREIADALGLNQPLVSHLEHGHYIPTLRQAHILCELLAAPLGSLFSPEQIAAMPEEKDSMKTVGN